MVELARGLEPRTTGLQNRCSTVELRQPEPKALDAFSGAKVRLRPGSVQAKLAPPRRYLRPCLPTGDGQITGRRAGAGGFPRRDG